MEKTGLQLAYVDLSESTLDVNNEINSSLTFQVLEEPKYLAPTVLKYCPSRSVRY